MIAHAPKIFCYNSIFIYLILLHHESKDFRENLGKAEVLVVGFEIIAFYILYTKWNSNTYSVFLRNIKTKGHIYMKICGMLFLEILALHKN